MTSPAGSVTWLDSPLQRGVRGLTSQGCSGAKGDLGDAGVRGHTNPSAWHRAHSSKGGFSPSRLFLFLTSLWALPHPSWKLSFDYATAPPQDLRTLSSGKSRPNALLWPPQPAQWYQTATGVSPPCPYRQRPGHPALWVVYDFPQAVLFHLESFLIKAFLVSMPIIYIYIYTYVPIKVTIS